MVRERGASGDASRSCWQAGSPGAVAGCGGLWRDGEGGGLTLALTLLPCMPVMDLRTLFTMSHLKD